MRYLLDEGNAALWLSSAAIVFWIIQYSALARWWRNFLGVTIVGLAFCLLLVYVPSLLALAWPAEFAGFASTRWYQDLAVGIVNATAIFMVTRIMMWEYVRRRRAKYLLPSELAAKVASLEAEVAALRSRLGEEA